MCAKPPELGFIKLRNTGSGTVEVHWDAWNGFAYKRAGDYTWDFRPADADNGTWDLFGSVNGKPELGFIKLRSPAPPAPPPVRLDRISFARLPKGATISVACGGRGCPRPRAVSARARHLKALVRALEGRGYRVGDRLFIRISAPGLLPERAEVWIRYGAIPRARLM